MRPVRTRPDAGRRLAIEEGISCPWCGGRLELVTDGGVVEPVHPGYHIAGTPLPTRFRSTTFAACTRCEWCVELR